MRRVTVSTLLLLHAAADACDMAPPINEQIAQQLKQTWSPCPAGLAMTPQIEIRCITSKLTPAQVRTRLNEAEWIRNSGQRDQVTWVFNSPEQGEVLKLNRISLYPHGEGSLLVWRRDLKLLLISESLFALHDLNGSEKLVGKPCKFSGIQLQNLVKQCEIVNSDEMRGYQGLPTVALKLVFTTPFSPEIQRNRTYFYYRSTICPVWELRPAWP